MKDLTFLPFRFWTLPNVWVFSPEWPLQNSLWRASHTVLVIRRKTKHPGNNASSSFNATWHPSNGPAGPLNLWIRDLSGGFSGPDSVSELAAVTMSSRTSSTHLRLPISMRTCRISAGASRIPPMYALQIVIMRSAIRMIALVLVTASMLEFWDAETTVASFS